MEISNIYDPNFNPLQRPVSLKQEFNNEISQYMTRAEREGQTANLVLLLCPSYPHDGTRFRYDLGAPITGEACPTLNLFAKKIDILLHGLKSRGSSLDNLQVHALVCEIESDLPNVLERFSYGDESYFNEAIASSTKENYRILQSRYPYIKVNSQSFGENLTDLGTIRQQVADKMAGLLEAEALPAGYLQLLKYVASNRDFMFERLYGANDYNDKFNLAFRQMCNYLSVAKSLALKHTDGCVVLNTKTPNAAYLNVPKNTLREVLDLDPKSKLPLFNFF